MVGPCAVCAHEIRAAFGFAPSRTSPTVWTDTPQCAALAARLYGKSEIMTENEKKAQEVAVDAGGEFLASIKKFDLRDLSDEELATFSSRIFETYRTALFDLAGGNKIPF